MKRRKILSDEQLDSYSKEDFYKRKKRILDAIMWCFIMLLLFLTFALIFSFCTNEIFRNKVLDQLAQNIISLIVFSASALGITFTANKRIENN